MTTAVFDTLKTSRDLKSAGIDEAHAEAIVTAMAGAFEDTVATKADIVAVRADMDKLEASIKGDIAAVKADMDLLKADMNLLKADMLAAFSNTVNRMLIAQLAVAGLLFAALKLF